MVDAHRRASLWICFQTILLNFSGMVSIEMASSMMLFAGLSCGRRFADLIGNISTFVCRDWPCKDDDS